MTQCRDCHRDLETVTEQSPCTECGYSHEDELSPFQELNFNEDKPREYESDFHEVYDRADALENKCNEP